VGQSEAKTKQSASQAGAIPLHTGFLTKLLVFLGVFMLIPTAFAGGSRTYCGNFFDVASNAPYCEAINYTRDRSIFEGYATGYFYPERNINRAEVLKVVLAAFIDEKFDTTNPPDGSLIGFKDTPNGISDWYYVYLKRAKDIGFVQGYSDNTFRAGNNVTRAEFIKMFLYLSPFKYAMDNMGVQARYWEDVSREDWFYKYISFADFSGLLNDFSFCGANRLCPGTAITRGEVAQFMLNYKKFLNRDVGFPKSGLMSKMYATTNSLFYLSDLPANAKGVFKVPGRVFDSDEIWAGLKNVDCSQPTGIYLNSIKGVSIAGLDPWIYFYSSSSNWQNVNSKVDFYYSNFSNAMTQNGVYGPFNDSLQKLLDDIVGARCINGTFGPANYSGIPENPNPAPRLGSAVLTAPANSSQYTGKNPDVIFSWNPVAGAVRYDLMVKFGGSTNYTTYTMYPGAGEGVSYTVYAGSFPVLSQDYVHHWKVRAYDASGNYNDSAEWLFYVYKPAHMLAPVLSVPANNAQYYSINPNITFGWNPVTGAIKYELMVKFSNSSSWNVYSTTANTYYFPANNFPALTGNVIHTWKVRAYDGVNFIDSDPRYFTIWQSPPLVYGY